MLKANLKDSGTYQGEDLEKLNRALVLLEQTINGITFKKAILQFNKFQFERYKCFLGVRTGTVELQQYTNEEILEIILKGHRINSDNSFMDLKLTLSEKSNGTAVGETSFQDVTTTYRTYFDSMTEAVLAAHIMHEWMHTLGFEHSYSDRCDPSRNCHSVPYAIGNIVEIILTGSCFYGCEYVGLNKVKE